MALGDVPVAGVTFGVLRPNSAEAELQTPAEALRERGEHTTRTRRARRFRCSRQNRRGMCSTSIRARKPRPVSAFGRRRPSPLELSAVRVEAVSQDGTSAGGRGSARDRSAAPGDPSRGSLHDRPESVQFQEFARTEGTRPGDRSTTDRNGRLRELKLRIPRSAVEKAVDTGAVRKRPVLPP